MLHDSEDTEEIIERVAALDIGKAELVACIRVPNPDKPGRRAQEITAYSTMTRSLLGLADRLHGLGVTRVVMEATSDYWKPVFYLLEARGLDPWLVNAKDVKHLPGRPKTDKLDAVWLAKVAERRAAARRGPAMDADAAGLPAPRPGQKLRARADAGRLRDRAAARRRRRHQDQTHARASPRTPARAESLPHADFLSLILADEADRRDRTSAQQRARAAKLDPAMHLDTFELDTGAAFDRELWHELCSLRFIQARRSALILGPVGVGKTHLATALGHAAIRRRHTVAFYRADQLLRRLKAARLDNTHEAEMRRLARLDLLILDDLALQAMDPTETTDFYELTVERHRSKATVVTSNRDPSEWIAMMSDPLLAQSAVDRLTATAYELVIDGQSYRRRQRPQRTATEAATDHNPDGDGNDGAP
jgi:DNA replication protein DnaC